MDKQFDVEKCVADWWKDEMAPVLENAEDCDELVEIIQTMKTIGR